MNTVFYLARHGETQWNKVQRFQGQLDSELTPRGKQQSSLLAQEFTNVLLSHIVCSPLGRAVNTANICRQLLNVPIKIDPALKERDLGPWQGQYLDEISHRPYFDEILHQFTDRAPPNGESATCCGQRIYHALKQLALTHLGESLLVVFHGEALRCFLSALGQQQCGNAYELYKNASVTRIEYSHQGECFSWQ